MLQRRAHPVLTGDTLCTMSLCWPLRIPTAERLLPDAPGQFGTVRRHDVHTGVDLYCVPGTLVQAMEDGVVLAVEPFTGAWCPGEDASPWWNDTAIVLVQGASGVLGYGEVTPDSLLVQAGECVCSGQALARIEVPVLKRHKGRPTVMLHLERYAQLYSSVSTGSHTLWWPQGTPQPPLLLDPTPLLLPLSTGQFSLPLHRTLF